METKNEYKKRIEAGQDIFDLCIQEYGGLNALFLLLADNPQLDLVRKLVPGEEIKLRVETPKEVPLNKNQMDYFRKEDIKVNMQENELLQDDVVLVITTGDSIQAAPTGFTIAGSNTTSNPPPNPVTLDGVLTSSGKTLLSSTGAIIRPQTAPTIGTSNGFTLLTDQRMPIKINLPILTYLITASGNYISTAQGDLLIL
ncbi:hypothetical protein [Aureispira sp. CCB-QB1]|uniref:hypothetical protein n=1 Tax=Aureispira sp. CCB-QB1 TaxID=1313421 RepID=UPI0006987E50|nr:hypothetical protein [Aureispira sp. CCB-QB1]